MFRRLLRRLAIRASVVFVLIHAGLLFAVYGLASLPRTPDTVTSWWVLAGGITALYGAMLLAAFFVIWPLFTLARKVRQILRWKEWIVKELPALIALIPVFVKAVRDAFAPMTPGPQAPTPPQGGTRVEARQDETSAETSKEAAPSEAA